MKVHDLKRTSGKAVLSVWPPQVLADVGTTFVRPGDGVLKGVRRIAKRLSLVIEQREARSCRPSRMRRTVDAGRRREGAQGAY
jgi:hypothetical protein